MGQLNRLFANNGFEAFVQNLSFDAFIVGLIVLALGTGYLMLHKYSYRTGLLAGFAGGAALIFAILAIGVIALHVQSDSAGPKHRQVGLEFWLCDTEVSPRYQRGGLIDKTGSGQFYLDEHKQAYRSGFVLDESTDAGLARLMQTIGGDFQPDAIAIPLAQDKDNWLMPPSRQDGDPQGDMSIQFLENFIRQNEQDQPVAELTNGQRCHNTDYAELQIFVYRVNEADGTYYQEKLDQPDEYVFPEVATVPPGDCVIVEFAEPKPRTNKLCQSYGVRDATRCSVFGAERIDSTACNLQEVQASGEPL